MIYGKILVGNIKIIHRISIKKHTKLKDVINMKMKRLTILYMIIKEHGWDI